MLCQPLGTRFAPGSGHAASLLKEPDVPIADIADATPQSKGLGKLSDSAVIVEPPEHPEEPALVMPEARSEATGHDRAAQTLSYS